MTIEDFMKKYGTVGASLIIRQLCERLEQEVGDGDLLTAYAKAIACDLEDALGFIGGAK